MRMLTICSDGIIGINQQSMWNGYSTVPVPELLKDIEIFVNTLTKGIKERELTKESIDQQIDELLEKRKKL